MPIRQVPPGITDANLAGFLRDLRNSVVGVNEQVTKIIQLRGGSGSGPSGPISPNEPGTPGPTGPTGPGGKPDGDGFPPPAPTSLTATPDIWSILLEWTNPDFWDYKHTEIWAKRTFPAYNAGTTYSSDAKVLSEGKVYRSRKRDNTGNPLPVSPAVSTDWWEETTLTEITERTMVGAVAGTAYTFTGVGGVRLTGGETWTFWVRNADTENLFSDYFPADDVGVSATTLIDPGQILDALTGWITASQLYQDLGSRIDLIDGTVDMPNSVNARLAAQYNTLVQQINEISVGNGVFDTATIWHFDGSADGWTAEGTNVVVTWENSHIDLKYTGVSTGGALSPEFVPISGGAYPTIRTLAKRMGGTGWVGILKFKTSNNVWFSSTAIVEPPPLDTEFVEVEWNLSNDTNWTANNIKQISILLGNSNGDYFDLDWVGIGRNAPGASYAQVEAVRVLADNKNRVFFQNDPPSSNASYTLKVYDLWFDTNDGNKPYRWNGSTWVETTDTRLADAWAEIWDIKTANANPTGAAAQRINGISANASSALANAATALGVANTKATITDVNAAFAGPYSSLANRLSGTEASIAVKNRVYIQSGTPSGTFAIGDLWYDTTSSTNVILKYWSGSAWVVRRTDVKVYYTTYANRPTTNLQVGDTLYDTAASNKPYLWDGSAWVAMIDGYIDSRANALITNYELTKVGYATLNSAPNTPFDGDGVTVIYPANVYPDATYPLYKDNRYRIIDENGVSRWNISQPSQPATWHKGLPFASAVKQVSVSDGSTSVALEQRFVAQKTTNDQLMGQYYLKIDNDGFVSGFGLASEPAVANQPRSMFGIRADAFWLGPPMYPAWNLNTTYQRGAIVSYGTYTTNNAGFVEQVLWVSKVDNNTGRTPPSGTAGNTYWAQIRGDQSLHRIPFIVVSSDYNTTINGVPTQIKAGVYMDVATIMNASINEAHIRYGAINSAHIKDYIASTDFPGTNDDGTGAPIMSSNTGWAINKDGTAVFNNVRVRGDILLGGANLIQNSEGWQDYTDIIGPWTFGTVPTYTASIQTDSWASVPYGMRVYRVNQTAGSTDQASGQNWNLINPAYGAGLSAGQHWPIEIGKTYQFSAYTAANGCKMKIYVDYLNSAGSWIGNGFGTENSFEKFGGRNLSDFKRIGITFKVPATVGGQVPRFVVLGIQKLNTMPAYTFSDGSWTRAMFCEVPEGQPTLVPWSPGGISLLNTLALRQNAATALEVAAVSQYDFNNVDTADNSSTYYNSVVSLPVNVSPAATQRLLTFSFTMTHADSTPGWITISFVRNGTVIRAITQDVSARLISGTSVTSYMVSYTDTVSAGTSVTYTINIAFNNATANKWNSTLVGTAMAQMTNLQLSCFTSKR